MSDENGAGPAHHERGSHYQPSPGIALLLLVLFVAAVVLVLHGVSDVRVGGNGPSGSTTTTSVPTSTTTTTLARSNVKVQVANGTSVSHLALKYSNRLTSDGWDVLSPVNANSLVSATRIYFQPGFRADAHQIAREIKVSGKAAVPLGSAKPAPGYQGDDVIVVVGPDL